MEFGAIFVDGSFNEEKQIIGSGVVFLTSKTATFSEYTVEKYSWGWNDKGLLPMKNVSGELMAAYKGMALATSKGIKYLKIYYDYTGVKAWITGEWQAKNPYTQAYRNYVLASDLVPRFEHTKAHTGVYFNEVADRLAKKGAGYIVEPYPEKNKLPCLTAIADCFRIKGAL